VSMMTVMTGRRGSTRCGRWREHTKPGT